jgi:dihydroorotase
MREPKIIQPDDWHCHLRDGAYLSRTVADSAAIFKRVIVMPNLTTPVTHPSAAKKYRERILNAVPEGSDFEPLMTLYLTDETTPHVIAEAKVSGIIYGAKLYPQGVTTHSEAGVTKLEKIYHTLEAMSEHHIPLLIHGEVNDPAVDIFDREKYFIDKILTQLVKNFPTLKIVFEHITTKDAVLFVEESSKYVAATITPHHLYYQRNAMFTGGIRPHYYCLPILKRQEHQLALIEAATSGNPKFFIGTDSAPHAVARKESSCGCAGIYNSPTALALYAEIFDAQNKLHKLEGFTSLYGADFYGLPHNQKTITLRETSKNVPETLSFGDETIIPLKAGQSVKWDII